MKLSLISKLIGTAFVLVLTVAAATIFSANADDAPGGYGPGYGMGPGMMGGYGDGSGYGGMMGGSGMGPGMMGGGCGQMGMMGGMMGQGMMGGVGMGSGMMGNSAVYGLDLSDAQRTKIDKIIDGQRKQHWSVMGGMMDVQSKLRDLYRADPLDAKKIGAAYAESAKLGQQLVESQAESQNQIRSVLTKEQREQLRQWSRGGGSAAGAGHMPGAMMGR